MKTTFLNIIMIAILVLSTNTTYATLKRLNNNPGIVADYSTIDAALAAQGTWDTLYVEPSATTYLITQTASYGRDSNYIPFWSGFLEAYFKVIIGNGYYLENGNPNYTPPPLQNNKLSSKIGSYVVFDTSQTNHYLRISEACTCIGLSFVNEVRQQKYFDPFGIWNMNNINLISCKFELGIRFMNTPDEHININNIKISKCFIEGIYFTADWNTGTYELNNFIFENNIIHGPNASFILNDDSIQVNGFVFRNNIIEKGFNCKDAYCANNIFLDTDTTHFNFSDNNVKNNIFVAPAFSLSNVANAVNNQFNVSDTSLFNPFAQVLTGNPEAAYYLKPGVSPAIGAGVPNGATPVDCGAFGGPDPYKLSGIPPFPTIYELSVPAVIPAGTQMNITLSTRSNN